MGRCRQAAHHPHAGRSSSLPRRGCTGPARGAEDAGTDRAGVLSVPAHGWRDYRPRRGLRSYALHSRSRAVSPMSAAGLDLSAAIEAGHRAARGYLQALYGPEPQPLSARERDLTEAAVRAAAEVLRPQVERAALEAAAERVRAVAGAHLTATGERENAFHKAGMLDAATLIARAAPVGLDGAVSELNLEAVWDRYGRATACSGPPNIGWNLAIASARDVPPLLAEVWRLRARVAELEAAEVRP